MGDLHGNLSRESRKILKSQKISKNSKLAVSSKLVNTASLANFGWYTLGDLHDNLSRKTLFIAIGPGGPYIMLFLVLFHDSFVLSKIDTILWQKIPKLNNVKVIFRYFLRLAKTT